MARTLRSKALRNALWLAAGGRCQACACELPEDWHADHVVPYSVTERTNVHEMQALCPECNRKKGSAMASLAYSIEYYPGMRQGVLEAIKRYRDWLKAVDIDQWRETRSVPDPDFSAILPTRYGKSDFMRTACLAGQADSLSGPGLVLHPGIILSNQFLEQKRIQDWRRRWNAHYSRPVVTLADFGPRPYQNDEWLGSVHIQALLNKEALVKDFAEHLSHKYRLPPVMFVDETHQYTKKNQWGRVPRAWVEGGGLIVVVTATAFRHDEDDLIGFRQEVAGREPHAKKYWRRHEDPQKVWVITDIGEKTYYKLEADYEYPYKAAWTEKAIAKSSVDWIDVEMCELTTVECSEEDKNLKLSEIPRWKVGRILSAVCRDPAVVREFARRVVKHLRTFRNQESTEEATFVAYGLNDAAGMEPNAHQEAIRDAIGAIDPALKVVVATIKSDDMTTKEEERSAKVIAKFTDRDAKTIDGLVLKQMGNQGLDSDRICVVGTLDNIRSAAAKIQQWNRGGNVWGGCRQFVIVSLKDALSQEIYKAHIADEGGEASQFDISLTQKEEKDKKEGPELPMFRVVKPIQSGSIDSDGYSCTPLDYARAMHLLIELPELIHSKSIPQIAEKAVRLGVEPIEDREEEEQCDFNASDEAGKLVGSLNQVVKYGARLLFKIEKGSFPDMSSKDQRDEYGGRFKPQFIGMVKSRAGVEGTWDQKAPDRIRSLETLRTLLGVAEQLIGELTDEAT